MPGWTVILPMRALDRAKSRLRPATTSATNHRDLVTAMRRDSVAAVSASLQANRVVIVAERVDEIEASLATAAAVGDVVVIADPPGSGLNPALRHAAEWVRERWPDEAVAALVADLPALTPATLDQVLRAAGEVDRGFVVDQHYSGTTMLTAGPGVELLPMFGAQSAGRHAASGAIALPAAASVRADVDVPEDLAVVTALGVGPATLALLTTTTSRAVCPS
jgi:2-phospho-L-lactate guanylyltransferase